MIKKHMCSILLFVAYAMIATPINAQNSINAGELMEEISENFHSKHAKEFASELLQYRTIEQNGKFVDFVANIGFYANTDYAPQKVKNVHDLQIINTKIITIFRSDSFDENGEKLKTSDSNYYKGNDAKKFTMLNYGDNDFVILQYLTFAMINSPLNDSKVDLFAYKITKEYENKDNDNIIELSFENKDWGSLKKTRILAFGKIIYNKTKGFTEKIAFDSGYRDYSARVYTPTPDTKESITQSAFEIDFKLKNEEIYPKSASFVTEWIDAKKPTSSYVNMLNPRINPIGTNLIYREKIEFTNSVKITKEQIKKLKLEVTGSIGAGDRRSCYQKNMWSNVVFSDLDFDKVKVDLNVAGESLFEQAERNNGRSLPSESEIEYIDDNARKESEARLKYQETNKDRFYRQITEVYYPVLFGKEYKYGVLTNNK